MSSSINWDFPDESSLTTVASSSHEFTPLRHFDKAIPSAPGFWPSRQMAANQGSAGSQSTAGSNADRPPPPSGKPRTEHAGSPWPRSWWAFPAASSATSAWAAL